MSRAPPAPDPAAVSLAEAARVDAWLRAVDARAARVEEPRFTFLVVTPLGAPARAWLWRTLADAGIALAGRSAVPSWAAVSSALYVRRTGPGALRRAVIFERAWDALFPGAAAEAWAVAPGSHALLEAVKPAVRADMRHVRIELDGSARGAVLHPFHVADRSEAPAEARRLLAAVSLGACRTCDPRLGAKRVTATRP